jgi:hypothetical protein
MGVLFTSSWAQKEVKTLELWQNWLTTLKEGDKVLVQEFVPQGNRDFCLDSQVECWKFSEAKFVKQGLVVTDYADIHVEDGIVPYRRKIMAARIVPWHIDVAPENERTFSYCHAPVFDPLFSNPGARKHLVLANKLSTFDQIKKEFGYSYCRNISSGDLITFFTPDTVYEIEKLINLIDGAKYLYSEALN